LVKTRQQKQEDKNQNKRIQSGEYCMRVGPERDDRKGPSLAGDVLHISLFSLFLVVSAFDEMRHGSEIIRG
jgi:hypothetical protein